MSKLILVSSETNRVVQVSDAEFEVHQNLAWHTVEDINVAAGWEYNPADNTVFDPVAKFLDTPAGKRQLMIEQRKAGYGTVQNQLDAIYRDLRDGTTIFVDHITAVKAAIPKVPPVDEHDKDTIINE